MQGVKMQMLFKAFTQGVLVHPASCQSDLCVCPNP
jgi:hypothetical protein